MQTLFIRGFDKSSGLDQVMFCKNISSIVVFLIFVMFLCMFTLPQLKQVRSALEEHFGTCGEISRLSIQKEYGTDELKGYLSCTLTFLLI